MKSPVYTINAMAKSVKRSSGSFLKELGLQLDRVGSQHSNDIAYLKTISRHRKEFAVYDKIPTTSGAWVAPNAQLLGDVHISKWATVWYNASLRAELNPIRIGHFSSIGEGTNIFTTVSLPMNVPQSANIGKNVSVGSNCSIYSSIIDDDVVIGNNCVIGEGCVIERGAQLADFTVVPPGRLIPAGQLWSGNPCEYV